MPHDGRRRSLKGMPPWLALPVDASMEASDSSSPPTEPRLRAGFATPDAAAWAAGAGAGAGKSMSLGSPLFVPPPRAPCVSVTEYVSVDPQFSPPRAPQKLRPPVEAEPSLVERTLSALSSLLTTDSTEIMAAANASANRPPLPLSPPPAVRSAPRILPSACDTPKGCPVAGVPIPLGHSCGWCRTCTHPGPRVFLQISGEAEHDDEVKELKEENLRLHIELRASKKQLEQEVRVQR